MIHGTSAWLPYATVALLFHTLGWDFRYATQVVLAIFMAYEVQPEPNKVLIYALVYKGLQYACIGLVLLRGLRCLLTRTTSWAGPGKVLLIPCKRTHSSSAGENHTTAYSCLHVGIPVGWEGVSGGLVSSSSQRTTWSSAGRTCLYNVDAADHLEDGEAHLSLRGKLDMYLDSQVREEYPPGLHCDTDETH